MKRDNYIKVLFLHSAFEEVSIESAWVKIEKENFILDNILFYAKEYSLGDKILVKEQSGEFYANGVVSESGHSTIRILFSSLEQVGLVREQFNNMGCASELSNIEKLIAVDIPPTVSYTKIANYLDKKEKDGELEYEEACISSFHRG